MSHVYRPFLKGGGRVDNNAESSLVHKPEIKKSAKLSSQIDSGSKSKKNAESSVKQKNRTRYVLAILLLVVVGYTIKIKMTDETKGSVASQGLQVSSAMRERVLFYRDEVGHRLNRERLGVQIQNTSGSPPLPDQVKTSTDYDMLRGIQLEGEPAAHREHSRSSAEKPNPDYADAYVEYSLREQQLGNDFDKQMQKQYVDEFIANAARAGYKVKVDKDGKVIVIGRYPATGSGVEQIKPEPNSDTGPAGHGAIR